MHRRGVLAAVAALVLAGCSPSPTSAPTATPAPTAPTGAARLHVTGSGILCYQWYAGCRAFLAVVDPGWSLPDDWAESADDTEFLLDIAAGEEAVRVTGVRQDGQEWIHPGRHRLIVIKTVSPDAGPSVGVVEASILCAADVEIAAGAGAVNVDVAFDASCSIRMSAAEPSPAPSG